jgi:putative transcriptional regulator
MKKKVFDELLASVGEALEHARGKRELRTTVLPPPPKPMDANAVKKVRRKLNASQAVFAHCLNVSTKLVQAWEAGRRVPDGPALVLLRLVEKDPAIVVARGPGRAREVA